MYEQKQLGEDWGGNWTKYRFLTKKCKNLEKTIQELKEIIACKQDINQNTQTEEQQTNSWGGLVNKGLAKQLAWSSHRGLQMTPF